LAETRAPDDGRAPLTYQVFNPSSAPALARPSAPSRVSDPEERSSTSVGLRVCLVLLGVCVVVGTAGAIILSGTDDPPHAASAPPTATVSAAPAPSPPPPAPAPPPVVIGDPPAPAPAAPAATTSAKPAASAKPKPAGSAALEGAKIPPNPFGLPTKRK
ncbi:MAG TPA: hypothetical protein VLT33_14830, partial [Labilithrix sp.]|nr:hypothetical protein [Labilithrix sp.]